MLFSSYPAEIPLWGIGAGSWVMFVLHQIGKTAPFLRVFKANAHPNWTRCWHHHRDGTLAF